MLNRLNARDCQYLRASEHETGGKSQAERTTGGQAKELRAGPHAEAQPVTSDPYLPRPPRAGWRHRDRWQASHLDAGGQLTQSCLDCRGDRVVGLPPLAVP